MKWTLAAMGTVLILGSALAMAQAQTQPSSDKFVTREEHEKVLQRLDKVTSELEAVKKSQAAMPAANAADTDKALDEVDKTIRQINDQLKSLQPGDNRFLVSGYGFVQFENHRGSNSTFSAGVNPVILWNIGPRLIFETEFEIELNSAADGGGTAFNLEIADLAYVLTDWLTVGGGKFKAPIGIYNNRLESKWINKFPDRPLPYADEIGIAPEAAVGIFARGAFNCFGTRFNYDVFVSNGPTLQTDSADTAGSLDFDNFVDVNQNKAVGGRIGWQPIPELEIGYSMEWAKVDPQDFGQNVHSFIQALDLTYIKTYKQIAGQIDFRAEWVFSNTSGATYDPTHALGFGPLRYNNDRNSGYVQLAYRPTLVDNKILKNLEFVLRYERLNISRGAPEGGFFDRYGIGIDYWINPSTVIKTAYECERHEKGPNSDSFYVQAVLGF